MGGQKSEEYQLEGFKKCYSGSRENTTCNFKANGYRLPTEAEWEYAARGGTQSQGYKYSGSYNFKDVAWYVSNSGSKTHPVGSKVANELGIYDMTGNTTEWCWDWYDENYYENSLSNNPTGPGSGRFRVERGGYWDCSKYVLEVYDRDYSSPIVTCHSRGFRIVRAPNK